MASGMTGLWRAEVVNTENFKDTGKIQIKVWGIYPENVWEEAEIMTPFGGYPNMGMQMLPPIGAQGFVMYLRGKSDYPIWVGGLIRNIEADVEGTIEEEWAHPVESEDPSDFIIKTQYTKFDEREIDGEENKIENILKMNENEFTLAKVHQSDEYAYDKEPYDMEEKAYNLFQMKDDEVKLKFKFSDNSKSNTISVKEGEISISFDTDAGEMNVSVKEETIEFMSGGTTMVINKDGTVVIDAEKLEINGGPKTAALYEGFRDFVNNAYNGHTHGTPSGPSSPPTKPYKNTDSAKSESTILA